MYTPYIPIGKKRDHFWGLRGKWKQHRTAEPATGNSNNPSLKEWLCQSRKITNPTWKRKYKYTGPDEGKLRGKSSGRIHQVQEMLQIIRYWKSTVREHSRDCVPKELHFHRDGVQGARALAQSTSPAAASGPGAATKVVSKHLQRLLLWNPASPAGLVKSCLTVQAAVCTVSHLVKSRQTGKQMLLSSFCFSCCCLKKGISAIKTGSPSRGKHPNKPATPMGLFTQCQVIYRPFLSIILSLCMVGLSFATAASPLLNHKV